MSCFLFQLMNCSKKAILRNPHGYCGCYSDRYSIYVKRVFLQKTSLNKVSNGA